MIELGGETQIVIALFFGLFFGAFSYGLLWFFIFVLLFEAGIFLFTPDYECDFRLLLNLVGLIGWIVARLLFFRENGFEDFLDELGRDCGFIQDI